MIGSWLLAFFSFALFLFFQAQGIFTGDSGDVVTAAVIAGIPHPPGYPLYSLLGWLAAHIPLGSLSWRVTLLSSIPHAAAVGLIYALIYRLTGKNVFAAVFGAVSIATNYLFFLYSSTPEVFALFDLFVILLWYILVLWKDTKNARLLPVAAFVYGLSLSHHHLMLFFAPAIAYYVYVHRDRVAKRVIRRTAVFALVWFMLGFIPYVYIPLAASMDPILNWNRPVTWEGFIRLITRADYGTFVSGGSIGHSLRERTIAVSAYFTFLVTDWSWVGVILAVTGVAAWYRNLRPWFITWMIAVFFLGPAFFFYASFPLANRFTLGTYERFLLPSYLFIAIAVGCGLSWLLDRVKTVLTHRLTGGKIKATVLLVFVTFMVYPVSMGGVTLWRFWGLPQDRTAENLGRDILATAKPNSVLLLSQDTTLFTTQYVRYGLGVRGDTAVIHASRLATPDYQIVLKKHFPRLLFPDAPPARFSAEFIKVNSTASTRVYSNIILPIDKGWYWVPRGLLYEAVPYAELPGAEDMYASYLATATAMHNPLSGILSRYPHLMLSDVLDVYAAGHIAMGKTLMRAEKWEEARREFAAAVALSGDSSLTESLELLALSHLYFKDCTNALDALARAKQHAFVPSPLHLRMESAAYGECLGDEKRARELFSEYEKLERQSEESLEVL